MAFNSISLSNRRSWPPIYLSMDIAACLPSAIASITVWGPLTASPPAKISGSSLCNVKGSTFIVPHRVNVQAHSGVKQAQSASCPRAVITASTSIVNSEPGTGSGLRRPLSSGSVKRSFYTFDGFTRPFSPMNRTGCVRVCMGIPSSWHSSISSGLEGISSRPRR